MAASDMVVHVTADDKVVEMVKWTRLEVDRLRSEVQRLRGHIQALEALPGVAEALKAAAEKDRG